MPAPSRYHRQAILPFVGDGGQASLARAHAVIVGVGALGCASADLLARAGVGRITLIDRDVVERTNLQRQSLFSERDAAEGAPKAEAAARRLREVNSEIEIVARIADLTWRTAESLLGLRSPEPDTGPTRADDAPFAILDGTDNYETRYILNDAAVRHAAAYFYAGVIGAEGLAMPVLPARPGAPCLRCVFPEPPHVEARRTCDTGGVFGPAVAAIAAVQCADALKFLMGREDLITPALTRIDLERATLSQASLADARDPTCPSCAARRFDWLEGRAQGSAPDAAALCGRNAVQIAAPIRAGAAGHSAGHAPAGAPTLDLGAIEAKLRPTCDVRRTPFLLRATPHGEPLEITLFQDGRAIVSGTTDPARARAIVARYLGA